MDNDSTQLLGPPDIQAQTEYLQRARIWVWEVCEHRRPGAARDLAWALIGLARDHDPETYSPWLVVSALEPATLSLAINLANDIARLIRKADALQPNLVRKKGADQ